MTPLSQSVTFDDERDIATVYGVMVSGEVLRSFTTPTPPGCWFRIVCVEGGMATIETLREGAEQNAGARKYH